MYLHRWTDNWPQLCLQTQLAALRFVGVSATIPNIADIADWLGVPESGMQADADQIE
jgi:superfamily II RNA helicase